MAEFFERLKILRAQHKLSQQDLADALKISKSSINMYERGEREPGFQTLEAIASFFHVDMNYLMGKGRATHSETADDPLADELFACYGEVKDHFDENDLAEIKLFMRMKADIKRQKEREGK